MNTNADAYRLGYRADIEGLRAVAILLVIGAHAGVPWLGGGFVGVDIFFVLSGFLITGLLVEEIANTGKLRFSDFYIRRLRRLLPALFLMLLGSAIFAALLLAPDEQLPQAAAGVAAAAWMSNVHFALDHLDYFSAGTETNIFLHTWSLGVEEQFYLIWPAFVYFLLRERSAAGMERLRWAMAIVVLVSLGGCIYATYRAPQFAFYMMPLRAWQFAAGALVWLYFNEAKGGLSKVGRIALPARLLPVLGWLGLVLLLGAGVLLNSNAPYPGFYALIPTIGAACVIAAGRHGMTHGVSRLLAYWPMQAIGRVSYAWYLWHWPALLLGKALTGVNTPIYRGGYVVVSLVLAVASYYLVESPIRHQRWWLERQRVAIYGAVLLMVVGCVGMQSWSVKAYVASKSPSAAQFAMAQIDAPVIYGLGCDDWYHSDQVKFCAFGPQNAAHTAVLMGDSIAGQWFPAVAKAFDRPNWRLLILTKSSCPMVDEPIFYARIGRMYTECATWRSGALQKLATLKPDVVILSSVTSSAFTQAQWADGTVKVLNVIDGTAGHIYLLRGTPHLPFSGPDCLAAQRGRPDWLRMRYACSAPDKDDQADLVYQGLQRAAHGFANVTTLDMNDLVCPDGICAAQQRGLIVFRDSQHMTATFEASLGSALKDRLGVD